jgi:hypothetical protein
MCVCVCVCVCVYIFVCVPLSRNLGTLASWNPLGHSRPVTGLLFYLFKHIRIKNTSNVHLKFFKTPVKTLVDHRHSSYMFRTVPLSIVSSFSLYTQQWYMSYTFAESLRAGSGWNCSSVLIHLASCLQNSYDIYHCCVYSEELLMTDKETVRNM